MDYYAVLGLNRGASPEEIKKAYRSLAMKHHPDRGGNEAKFKEIAAAYELLSDPEKKNLIDMGIDPNAQPNMGGRYQQSNPFDFNFGAEDLNDIFRNFGFGGGFGRQQQSIRRNKSISIHIEVTLEECLTGKAFDAEISVPGGRKKTININIPPGIDSGQQVKYRGMGDDLYKDIPAGDLIVNIVVKPHNEFERNKETLICEKVISAWDAMLGSEIEITALNKKRFIVVVPPGTQPNTMLSCKSEGLPRINSAQRGDLLIRLKVEIPKNLSDSQKHLIETIKKNGI
jgi:curved DNA-binding protein